MALILNLETATTVCSVALAKDGQVLASQEVNDGYTHAENLTLLVQEVVKKAAVDLKALDAVAVSKGPGSFTGLRIGVSTAKGLCYGLEKPLIAVSTLQAMAWGAVKATNGKGLYCPMIDARRMEVYTCLFNEKNKPVSDISAKIIDEASFDAELKEQPVFFFGDGADKCRELLSKHPHTRFLEVLPSAIFMSSLSEQAYSMSTFEDVAYFEPFYLKDFVATVPKKLV